MAIRWQTLSRPGPHSGTFDRRVLPWPWRQTRDTATAWLFDIEEGFHPPMPQEIARWMAAKEFSVTVHTNLTIDTGAVTFTVPRAGILSRTRTYLEVEAPDEDPVDGIPDGPNIVDTDTDVTTVTDGLDGTKLSHRVDVALHPDDDVILTAHGSGTGAYFQLPTRVAFDYSYETPDVRRTLTLDLAWYAGRWSFSSGAWAMALDVTCAVFEQTFGPTTTTILENWSSGGSAVGRSDQMVLVGASADIPGEVKFSGADPVTSVSIAISDTW